MAKSFRDHVINTVAREATKKLSDEGKLVEAGWAAFAILILPEDAPPIQREEMRLAFMAGAEHLFHSIISVMDEEREPTADDLARMDLIEKELSAWRTTLLRRANQGRQRN